MENLLKEIKNKIALFPKFKNLLVGLLKRDDYYQINHFSSLPYMEDPEFSEMIGEIIKEVFYSKGITNVGHLDLIEEELEEFFPEMFNTKIKENIVFHTKKNTEKYAKNIKFLNKETITNESNYNSNEWKYLSQAA